MSFQPFRNPIGFGATDFIELFLAALFVVVILLWPWIVPTFYRLAKRPVLCVLILAALPVAFRIALLPGHPSPTPAVADEFSHLLAADTLHSLRLANPPHPLHQFFETFFVLQQPTYSSIYPLGQGLAMAIGRFLFGTPWAGVILSTAVFCALCYWMLVAWTRPLWALLGGVLAVVEFGPLNPWMNSYWGGAFAACAGCLVFGTLPRVRNLGRLRDGAMLGLGLGIHWITRPFETFFLALSVILFFLPALAKRNELKRLARPAAATAAVALAAIAITLAHNKQVTHTWTTLPEMLSQYQYGVPTTLTIQPLAVPHRELTPEQQRGYEMQVSFHGPGTDTPASYLLRLDYRVRFYRFFFLVPLYVALAVYLVTVREYRFVWVLITLALFAAGINLFPAFQLHYLAAVTCLFILISVVGLERLSRLRIASTRVGARVALLLLLLCMAHFVLWYGLNLFARNDVSRDMRRYETWDGIARKDRGPREIVNQQLAEIPGKLLVFVRYWPYHIFQNEWVYNAASIDSSRIVLARDLGAAENQKLQSYYPDRKVWLLEPDAIPPKLSPYEPEPAVTEQPQAPTEPETKATKTKPATKKPELRLEQVH